MIKIDKADRVFSQFIRTRDKICVRCKSKVEFRNGLPISHQNSHFFGRGKESTRFEPDNCDTLCYACHFLWGGTDHEAYRRFKIKQLGKERFKHLDVQAHTLVKKDRKMAYIIAKQLLEQENAKGICKT